MLKKSPAFRFLSSFILVTSVLFSISACQQELSGDGVVITPANNNWTLTAPNASAHPVTLLLKSMKTPDAVSTVVQAGGVCTANNFTFTVPDNAFVKLDGTPVTGTVTLSTTTASKFADMIFNGLGTVTNSSLLISGGMLRIRATQGADVLKLKAGKTLKVTFPEGFNAQFKGYVGVESGNVANEVTWNLNSNWIPVLDSLQGTGMRIIVDSLTWINCDRLSNLPGPFTNTYLKLPSQFGNVNTSCYIVFTSQKTIAGLYADAANQQFWQGANYKVPIGETVKLVAVSKQDNKIFYGSAQVTITANMTTTISTMDEITQAELNTRLNAL